MIKDYKGEMPKNVTTPEKAKAKKPFYKDWKFWVLTGLMTLFGACSIYGLVLGSQYVKAIERASHIIADAQESKSEVLSKNKAFVYNVNENYTHCFDLGSLSWQRTTYTSVSYYYFVGDLPSAFPIVSRSAYVLDAFTNGGWGYIENLTSDSMVLIQPNSNRLLVREDSITTGYDFKNALSGKYIYYLTTAPSNIYSDVYDSGSAEGYQEGYAEGSADGYEDGYQEGFDDGADSQANEQTIKVLLAPDFTGDRIQYSYNLDGAEVGTGYLSNTNQHYQNQVQFSRPAGGQHSAVLNLYSDNDVPIKIAYDTFTGTLGETRYLWYMKSNAYDWSTSQWYVPTYWAEARFLVTGYGTYDQGFTEDYFFHLDPQYNDRAKVGAYSEGYDAGYNDAVESGDAYDAGYDSGYADGQAQGETDGFNRGVAVGSSGSQSLAMMFKTAFQLPFDQLYRFLNFNLLGINFLSLFTALISVSIGIMVIKKVL